MINSKRADLDHPVHELISERWSPYVFEPRRMNPEDLRSLFEAARWAPSSYNEQPWSYIVAAREDRAEFDRVLSCLVEANRRWARNASVLILAVAKLRFDRDGRPNRAAHHDLGAAAANLSLEATARGLSVHQMGGILPDRARELFRIPDEYEPMTAIAVGYPGSDDGILGQRDRSGRTRKPVGEFVFSGEFGNPFSFGKAR